MKYPRAHLSSRIRAPVDGFTSGAKDADHGTEVVVKDSVKNVEKASEKAGEGIKDAASK